MHLIKQHAFWCSHTTYMVPVSLLKQSNAQYPEKVYLIKSLSKGMGLPTSPPHPLPTQGFTLVDAYKQNEVVRKTQGARTLSKTLDSHTNYQMLEIQI